MKNIKSFGMSCNGGNALYFTDKDTLLDALSKVINQSDERGEFINFDIDYDANND